jgi:hypothetical protein
MVVRMAAQASSELDLPLVAVKSGEFSGAPTMQ